MTTVVIRRAGPLDAAAAGRVWVDSRRAAGAAIPPAVHSDAEMLAFAREELVGRREAWLAVDGPDIVGLLVLAGDDLDQLFVHPGHQRRGVGSALLARARRERPGGLALWVFRSNRPALAFYRRHGFRVVRTTEGDNEEGAPDARMVWGDHPEGRAGPR